MNFYLCTRTLNMGSNKNKLERFAEMKSFANVFEPDIENVKTGHYHLKGNWREDYFKNDNPIVLELGCGKGEYTVGMAEKFPDKNFIAIDIKGARMYIGSKHALEHEMYNVAFLRTRIEFIESFFEKDEVDEIWITFPDPQIKRKRARKRLTHPKFLRMYDVILKSNSKIHLKTDSQFLHGFTLGVICAEHHHLDDATSDLYNSLVKRKHLNIKTFYESIFLKKGMPITYLRFSLNYKD